MEGTDAAEVVDELKPTGFDFVVKKSTYDSFHNTKLESLLKKLNATTVCITGLVTSICCQHTAAGAFFRGFRVVVVKEACKDLNEESHTRSLDYMKKMYGAEILTTDELIKRWEESS